MKGNSIFILILLFCTGTVVFAQGSGPADVPDQEEKKVEKNYFDVLEEENESEGKVKIKQDPEIRKLIDRHIELNEKIGRFQGWRIEIFSENGYGAREEAMKARKEFEIKYPDLEAYESYDGINFKVRVGDFRIKNDARRIQGKISEDYPATFIVKELVELPPL